MKLSVVMATKNEEANIGRCIESVKGIADEVIVFDEHSSDKTREIAKKKGAKVYLYRHNNNFHETKKAAMDKAKGDWILQIDADEAVSEELSKEIDKVLEMSDEEILMRRPKSEKLWSLFMKHQEIVAKRDGVLPVEGAVVAFYIPRRNYFLGKPLTYAGVYPDAAIRLVKNGKGYLPAKSVHEQMKIKGRVSWLFNDLEHYDSPTLRRYLERLSRYTDVRAKEMAESHMRKNPLTLVRYTFIMPVLKFLVLYFRHLGFKDGIRGFLWSVFSASQYAISYWKYWNNKQKALYN